MSGDQRASLRALQRFELACAGMPGLAAIALGVWVFFFPHGNSSPGPAGDGGLLAIVVLGALAVLVALSVLHLLLLWAICGNGRWAVYAAAVVCTLISAAFVIFVLPRMMISPMSWTSLALAGYAGLVAASGVQSIRFLTSR